MQARQNRVSPHTCPASAASRRQTGQNAETPQAWPAGEASRAQSAHQTERPHRWPGPAVSPQSLHFEGAGAAAGDFGGRGRPGRAGGGREPSGGLEEPHPRRNPAMAAPKASDRRKSPRPGVRGAEAGESGRFSMRGLSSFHRPDRLGNPMYLVANLRTVPRTFASGPPRTGSREGEGGPQPRPLPPGKRGKGRKAW